MKGKLASGGRILMKRVMASESCRVPPSVTVSSTCLSVLFLEGECLFLCVVVTLHIVLPFPSLQPSPNVNRADTPKLDVRLAVVYVHACVFVCVCVCVSVWVGVYV